MEEENCIKDYIGILKDSELLKAIQIPKKNIIYTDTITKVTTGLFNDDSALIITTNAIYNLKKKSNDKFIQIT